MAQRLFDTGKIGVFVDGYAPKVEKRNGDDVNCLSINCRIQPFDSKMAASLDNGVGGDSNIRPTVFSLTGNADPKPNFTRHDFKLGGLPSQNLLIYASPDTEDSRVALTQARIHGCYVRTQKDNNALAFCFRATFGPVGRDELELVHSLFRRQTFVKFEEGEPLLDVETDDEESGEAEEVQQHATAPMFDDAGAEVAAAAETNDEPKPVDDADEAEPVNRKLHSHAQGRKKAAAQRRGRK